MNKEELIKILGLGEDATDEQIMTAIKAGAQAVEELATERNKAEAAEAEKDAATKEKDEAKAELANERAARCGLLLDQAIAEGRISVARRFDERASLANEANYDESKHPRASDGKWTSGGGGGTAASKPWSTQKADDWSREVIYRSNDITRDSIASRVNKAKMELGRATTRDDDIAFRKGRMVALHRAAIAAGLKYNMKTHQYE